MISAGQQPTPVKSNRDKNIDNMCAAVVSSEVPANFDACVDRAKAAMIKAARDYNLDTPYKNSAFDTYVKVGVGRATIECANQNNISFGTGQFTPDKYEPYANCMRGYVVGANRPSVSFLNFDTMEGTELDFADAFIPYAAEMAGRASEQHIPLPANLINYMNEIKDIDNGFFAREAERLFRQAMANVPAEHKLLAAMEGGVAGDAKENNALDDVIDTIADAVAKYKAAGADAGKQKEAEEGLLRTYVSRVALDAPEYTVTFNQLPKDMIVNIFGTDQVPPAVAVALRRLLADATKKYYDNGGDPAQEASVLPAFEQAVKDQGIDPQKPDEWLPKIMMLRVVDVPLKADQSAASVVLGEAANAKAPGELLDGAHSGPLADARQELWNDIAALLESRGVEMDTAAVLGMLARPKAQGGIEGMDAVEVASQYPVYNEGLSLRPAPEMLFNAWQKIQGQSVPDSTTGTAAIGGHRALVRIYAAAMRDPKGWDSRAAADQINAWVAKVKDEENSAQTATHRITGASYGGMDSDNRMIIEERDGSKTHVDGSWSYDAEGWHFVYQAGGEGKIGVVSGVKGSEGSEPLGELYIGFRFGAGNKDTGNVTIGIAGLAIGYPKTLTPGLPEGEQNVSTNVEDGAGTMFRLNELSIGYDNTWKGSTTVGVDAAVGHIGVRPSDGTKLAMNSSMQPVSAYQPFTQRSSISDGGKASVALSWEDVKSAYNGDGRRYKATVGGVLGSALSSFQRVATGEGDKGTIASAGFRYGASLQGDFNLSGVLGKDVDWTLQALLLGAQSSSGEYEGKSLVGRSLLIGMSTMLQPHENFRLGLGTSYSGQNNEYEEGLRRFVIGGFFAAPFKTKDSDMTLTPGLGWAYNVVKTDERNPGGTETVGGVDCEPGYDCPSDGTADITTNRNGSYGSVADLPFLMAGNKVFEINPNFRIDWGKTGMFTGAGFDILHVQNVPDTKEKDTVYMPNIFFGRDF